jgi:hypothetical protein
VVDGNSELNFNDFRLLPLVGQGNSNRHPILTRPWNPISARAVQMSGVFAVAVGKSRLTLREAGGVGWNFLSSRARD